jgi:hypothetical protein
MTKQNQKKKKNKLHCFIGRFQSMYFNLIVKVKKLNPIQLSHSIQGACNVIQYFHLNRA